MPYFEKVREHFKFRDEFDDASLLAEFGLPAPVSNAELGEALLVFQEEYAIPMGLLRAADSMRIFLTPRRSSNPVTWHAESKQFNEMVGKLENHVNDCRFERGLQPPVIEPTTLREFAAVCLGVEARLTVGVDGA